MKFKPSPIVLTTLLSLSLAGHAHEETVAPCEKLMVFTAKIFTP